MNVIRYDIDGNPFSFPSVELDKREVSKIIHEVNEVYFKKYVGKKYIIHRSLDLNNNYCIYYLEIHGFSDYNIVEKFYD